MAADNHSEAQQTVYRELCTSYHAIADFRAKLLGFLPLASGAGIFLLMDMAPAESLDETARSLYFGAIGAFGLIITLGLFVYELRGIQRCNGLIAVGTHIEQQLGVRGQFRGRPAGGVISTTTASRVIYPAVLGAWVYLALVVIWPATAAWGAALAFMTGVAGSFAIDLEVSLNLVDSS